MGSGEVFRLGATTPPNAFAHASAYVQASAQADWSLRRGIDFTVGFDLQGKVDAEAGSSGVSGSFAAGVDVSGALAIQAELPIDLFSVDGAGLIARLRAKLALTAFVSAALTLDRSVLEQTLRANFGEPMSSLLDIVLEELDLEAGLWGRASLAIEALGEAVLAGTLLPSADNGAGLTFSTCYDTAFGYGAGVHFLANLGFPHPQRLFTRLTGEVCDQLLALVTPSDPYKSERGLSRPRRATHTPARRDAWPVPAWNVAHRRSACRSADRNGSAGLQPYHPGAAGRAEGRN